MSGRATRKPFSEINAYVYPKLSSPELFDCGPINLVKMVQHALVYYYINDRSKLMRPYWILPVWLINVILWLKRIKFRKKIQKQQHVAENISARLYLTMDINRPLTEINFQESQGKPASKFMYNIFKTLGRKNCFNMVSARPAEAIKVDSDLHYNDINLFAETLPINKADKELLIAMKRMWKRLTDSGKFLTGELKFINSQLHWFWINYRVYQYIVNRVKPSQCLLIPHYHREPLIAVLKLNRIPVIELQHASILHDSLYYIYPDFLRKVAEKALFADKILVWGKFWKDRLHQGSEYAPETIKIAGNYIYSREITKEEIDHFKETYHLKGKRIILITSQKMLTEHFAAYIRFLAADLQNKYPDWHLILKPHPGETNTELYKMNFPNYLITPKEVPVNLLFQLSNIHISIYSTTLYDAQAFPLLNFAITDAGISSDYAMKMVQEGIAKPIKMNENPLEKINIDEKSAWVSENSYIENFKPESLLI